LSYSRYLFVLKYSTFSPIISSATSTAWN